MSPQELLAAVRALGRRTNVFNEKHAAAIAPTMLEGERPLGFVWGDYDRKGPGFMIATDRRLIAMQALGWFGREFQVFPFDRVTDVQYHVGSFFSVSELIVRTAGSTIRFGVTYKEAADFAHLVQRLVTDGQRATAAATASDISPPSDPSAPVDVVSQLERLVALRDAGALTEAEFVAAKTRLLGE